MLASVLHGWRAWKSARAVALLAVAALAIGIGSTTAIYSLIHAVLLNPLPYANPERYYSVFGAWRAHPNWWTVTSYSDYLDYAAQLRSVEAYGCSSTGSINVTFNRQPVHVVGTQVSAALVNSFGVSPVMGRWFEQDKLEEDRKEPNGPYAAVISSALWRRFGSDPAILGKPVTIDGTRYTIVGVMPGWFRYPIYEDKNDVWIPLNPDSNQKQYRSYHYLRCVVKLPVGGTPGQASQDFDRILAGLRRQHPADAEPDFEYLIPVLEFAVEGIRPSLILLFIAAIALFVITCANVASVLLARSVARARDTAVRVALGATGWQLGVQYFAEGLIVSLAGTVLGSLLSYILVRIAVSLAADEIPRSDQIAFNWQVLGFALTLAVGCAFFFSFFPLWQAHRVAPNEALSEGTRASAGARSRSLLRFFVVAEVALAFALLVVGGLIAQHLRGLYRIHPGFDTANLLVMHVYAPELKYKTQDEKAAYETRLIETIRRLPGVENAGFTDLMPLTGWGNNTVMRVEGRPVPKNWLETESIEQRFISPDYFQSMRIPLLAGRFLTEADKIGDVVPMVINQTLAKLYWPNSNPLGAYVRILSWDKRFQIVGIVGDTRNAGLYREVRPEFYLSYRAVTPSDMTWAVRSPLPKAALTDELRRAVQSIDPDQPIFDVSTMPELIRNSLSRQRLQSLMIAFFAASALLLALLGLYGVIAYSVRQRITEMGTRMAMGAAPRDLWRLVIGDGIRMAAIGIGLGLVIVLGCARLLATSDLHVHFSGPFPFFGAIVLVAACTLLACWFPAWRAGTLSPMVAVRSDLHLNRVRFNYRLLTERISKVIRHAPEAPNPAGELLAAISETSRRAESFPQAIEAALQVLRERVQACAAYLFTRKLPDQPFRLSAAAAQTSPREAILPANALLLNRLRNYSSALPVSACELTGIRNWAAEFAPEHVSELDTLAALNARLAVPVLSKTEMIGILLLGEPNARSAYSAEECRAVRTAAAQLALMLENSRLTDRIVEQERLRRELLLAAEVQKRLFPEKFPETASIQLAGMCLPARGVGGDYYDFLDLGNRQIGIALADVAGKGIAAALIMSVVQASLRSLADTNGGSLAELASKMNRLLHRSTGTSSYATFFYGQIDEEQRRLRYVNAGHNPPLLLRAAETHSPVPFVASAAPIEELAAGGTIIGMFAQSSYEEASVELKSGDVMIAFSDGVTEAHNPDEEEFGEDRLKDVLRRTAHLPINEMASQILQELKVWMADAPQFDDLTFILMRVV